MRRVYCEKIHELAIVIISAQKKLCNHTGGYTRIIPAGFQKMLKKRCDFSCKTERKKRLPRPLQPLCAVVCRGMPQLCSKLQIVQNRAGYGILNKSNISKIGRGSQHRFPAAKTIVGNEGVFMPMNKIRMEICGSEYIISTTDGEDYTLALAEKLDKAMSEFMTAVPQASVTTAAVMCALSYLDELEKSSASADNMRSQITEYLDDAAKANLEAEDARRELERLRRQLGSLQSAQDKGE